VEIAALLQTVLSFVTGAIKILEAIAIALAHLV
jgi:hypothetical protein